MPEIDAERCRQTHRAQLRLEVERAVSQPVFARDLQRLLPIGLDLPVDPRQVLLRKRPRLVVAANEPRDGDRLREIPRTVIVFRGVLQPAVATGGEPVQIVGEPSLDRRLIRRAQSRRAVQQAHGVHQSDQSARVDQPAGAAAIVVMPEADLRVVEIGIEPRRRRDDPRAEPFARPERSVRAVQLRPAEREGFDLVQPRLEQLAVAFLDLRSDRVAAAYRLFGQEPYFLEEGDVAGKGEARPKVALGYVERTVKLLDLPVANRTGDKFGKVWSLTLNIPKGRILSVIVLAPGNFQTKSIVPAMALSFNAERDGLLLDDSVEEFADEPRYLFTAAAYGNGPSSQEETFQGPHTSGALEQGSSYFDIDRTVRIYRNIRAARINSRHVELATNNGRVTLRGWVYNAEDKRRIAEISVAASRLEVVDNQIAVGKPVASN